MPRPPHPWRRVLSDFDGPLMQGQANGRSIANKQQYGTSALCVSAATPQTVINVTDDDELADGFSIVLVSPTIAELIAIGVGSQYYANLRWGNGGVMAQATVDIARGLSIPMSCSSVQVDVYNLTNSVIPIRLGAFINKGVWARNHHPTFTNIRDVAFAVGAFYDEQIPTFADKLQVSRNLITEPFQVDFYHAGSAVISTYVVPVMQMCPELPIPPDAVNVRITHLAGVLPLARMRTTYLLAL